MTCVQGDAGPLGTGAQGSEHGTSTPAHLPGRWRVAVVGGGIAGLSCARELSLRGHQPVVFEASGRLGGRCSSLSTPVGMFDDAAQLISGANRLASYASVLDDELPALNLWTVPGAPVEDEGDDAPPRAVTQPGLVGVPSMRALADAMARPLAVRLNQAIVQARREGGDWVLTGPDGDIDDAFQAVVLALPAPLALPLARPSAVVSSALQAVRYRGRWVLLVGTERPVGLPALRTFEGSPIERVAAMHAKPGRVTQGAQRWFVEADASWSAAHAGDDPDTVTERLLDLFSAHARRPVLPSFIRAHHWHHAFVEQPAFTMGRPACLWDETTRLGVCGDSVTASAVDRAHRSGVNLALTVAHSFDESRPRRGRRVAASWDSPVRAATATAGS
jgi:predicted NAD/FAD-dependent oxidoreductase